MLFAQGKKKYVFEGFEEPGGCRQPCQRPAGQAGPGSAENSRDKTQEAAVLLFFVDDFLSLHILFSYC